MDAAALPSIASTLGVLEISMALGLFCTGVLTLQTWNYFRVYTNDLRIVQASVAAVHCLDVLHSAFLVHAVYQYTILDFGDYDAVKTLVWSFQAVSVIHGASIFIIQLFFCRRIYYLVKTWKCPAVGGVLTTSRLVFNILVMVTTLKANNFDVVLGATFHWQVTGLLAVGLTSDIFVTFCICRTLLGQRTGMSSSDGLVDHLVAFTIGSGLLTSVIALVELVTYLALDNYIFVIFYVLLGKIYSNALLASLNERNITRAKFDLPRPSHRLSVEVSDSLERMRPRPIQLDKMSREHSEPSKTFDTRSTISLTV